MKLPKWFMGTSDCKNYVITTDKGDLPYGAMPIPVHQSPTDSQIKALEDQGCKVRVIYPQGNSDASR